MAEQENIISHAPKHRRHVGLTFAVLLAVSLLGFSWRGTAQAFILAGFAGVVPALFWLWFWLKEDKIHPEPRRAIFKTFFFGALAVPFAILFEQSIDFLIRQSFGLRDANEAPLEALGPGIIFAFFLFWAIVEECAKYFAAANANLKEKEYNEPVDAAIYLISAAIGFSAFESILFVWQAIFENGLSDGLFLGQLRFIGAGLLHIVSSSLVGLAMGFAFYKNAREKRIFLFSGLLTAISLHVLFNFFIMISDDEKTLFVFAALWLATIAVFFLFEKVKRIKQPFAYVQ